MFNKNKNTLGESISYKDFTIGTWELNLATRMAEVGADKQT
jgi:hypothetical protein